MSRIVHVAPTPFGAEGILGGGERYPLELARALATSVETELVTFSRRPTVQREPNGLTIRELRPVLYAGHPAHPLAPALPAALRGADIIHTHHMRSAPSRLAALTGRLTGSHVVSTDHGLQGGDWHGIVPRLFDRFLLVSRYSADQLRVPSDRVHVIYGGADPARFHPEPGGVRNGVLFVGRLTPHKGIDRLLAALPENTRLLIAGSSGHDPSPPESDYPRLLREMAGGRDVRFLGPVADDDLPHLYRRAAVLALPSVHTSCYGKHIRVSELLGLVALEAMASGTPVVASRIGGLPEIVLHGITGYLVEPGNVEELRERLRELLWNPRLAERMGRHAREIVLQRFTWKAVARRCLDAYAELLPPNGR